MTYVPASDRYDAMTYRRCGRSGLKLPAISLGLWHNFGDDTPTRDPARDPPPRLRPRHHPLRPRQQLRPAARLRRDRTSAASCASDFRPYRDELIISTKAGYDMWPGPYGEWGSRKYLLAILDQSLEAHGARLRRHLLLAPLRPRHAARGDDGRARHRGPAGQGALRRHLVLLRPAHDRGGRAILERARHAAAHPPAVATRCSTAGSRRTCSTCWARRASAASSFSPLGQGMLTDQVPRRRPRAVARGRGRLPRTRASSPRRTSTACARSTRSPRAAARRSRRWRSPGCCATRA